MAKAYGGSGLQRRLALICMEWLSTYGGAGHCGAGVAFSLHIAGVIYLWVILGPGLVYMRGVAAVCNG